MCSECRNAENAKQTIGDAPIIRGGMSGGAGASGAYQAGAQTMPTRDTLRRYHAEQIRASAEALRMLTLRGCSYLPCIENATLEARRKIDEAEMWALKAIGE